MISTFEMTSSIHLRSRTVLIRPWFLIIATLAALTILVPVPAAIWADDPKPAEKEQEKDKDKAKDKDKEDEKPIVTHGSVTIGGKAWKYTATTGFMPLRDADGVLEAKIFYVAYTADEAIDKARRPVLFSFNGGPGSSSVWLHMGAIGPKRVVMPAGPTIPAPPFKLVENGESWLDRADLVFIDPVETGYSRAAKPELNKKFHGLKGDITSVGEFVRMYLSRTERWTSPLYVVGESYGTTRAAGLAGFLSRQGIALNGVILISSVLDFQALDSARLNEPPNVLFLPSFAATAWYHKMLPADLQALPLREVLDQAERFADGDYQAALSRGDRISDDDRARIGAQVARFTGLSPRFVALNNLRISDSRFFAEILRDRRQVVGRFDSRYAGVIEDPSAPTAEFDPSYAAVQAPYTTTFNQYVRTDLGYKTDVRYNILGSDRIGRWEWDTGGMGYPETVSYLREAMTKNPHLRVWVASGYYDLATPYHGADYTRDHLHLAPDQRPNVRLTTYEAGHMMYLDAASLAKLKRDAAEFITPPGAE